MRSYFVFSLLAISLLVAGCGGSVSSTASSNSSTPTGTSTGNSTSNMMTISVNGGPTGDYPDAAFASVTICSPGSTTNCTTVNNLLVDTGSVGLRVFQSAVGSLNLPTVNATSGVAAYNCVSYVDGSYMWGPVQQADVTLGGETAHKLPIQVIATSDTGVPTSCSNGGTNANTVESLGANGILGVGNEPTDCYADGFNVCGSYTSPYVYFTCSGTTCTSALISQANEVSNPVALLSTDNNGVIVELPSVSGSVASVTGSLVFGIGTESNNTVPSSDTIMTLTCDFFTTEFGGMSYGITNSSACLGPGSFIDSGSNGLFFPNATGIPVCPTNTPAGDLSSWYCPAATENLTATNYGANGTSLATNFSVANTESLFTSPTTENDNAMAQLGGVNPTGYGFDWGLPFFFGNNVYVSIDGQTMPSGTPAAPWWAY